MKEPVEPRLMRLMQHRRESGIKLVVFVFVVVLVISACVGVAALAYALGGIKALVSVSAVELMLIAIGALFFAGEAVSPLGEFLEDDRRLKEATNEIAWNKQQTEFLLMQKIVEVEL